MIQWLLIALIVGMALALMFRPVSSSNSNSNLIEGFVSDYSANIESPGNYALPVNTDPDDLPWLKSLSRLDIAARRSHSCTVMGERPGPDGTRLQTVARNCESGMPHTGDGDRIRIPDAIPEALREEIIRHELVHIWQRRHPDAWATFYRRQWSFEFHDDPPSGLPDDVIRMRRSNPDTWRQPWVRWMARWWPIAVYDDAEAPRLREAHTIWWDELRQTVITDPPIDWTAFFGLPSQDEHPHEIAAVFLADNATTSEAARRLQRWWELNGTKIRNQL
jgi:hypothetical protein